MKQISNKTMKRTISASFSSYNISTLILAFFKRIKRINSMFFVLSQSSYEKKSTQCKSGRKKALALQQQTVLNVILPEKTSGTYWMRRKQNVSKCWSLMWKKGPQKYWHITNPKLQHFFVLMWKMMDIVASRKCWILVERLWNCLNSLLESIYF